MSETTHKNLIEDIEATLIEANLADTITSSSEIKNGWTNLVFDINDSWIFRFARFAESKQIEVEKAFLPSFSKVSPVPIPNPINLPQSNYQNFIAYDKIQGEKLSQERVSNFNQKELTQVCKAIGEFLSALHKFNFEHDQLLEYPYGGSSFWNELWPVVSPRLKTKTKHKAHAFFKDTITLLETNPVAKTITHSDLGTSNLLVNTTSNQLAGIIDFGDIAIADPAIDFSSFYRNFGRNFVETIVKHYSPPLRHNFWLRVDYQSKRKLFLVTYFALNYGYEDTVPDLIKMIEAVF